MRLLVCGGAGYIGSHMCKMLAGHGHDVATYDDLSTGHREAARWGQFFAGDLAERSRLKEVFDEFRPDAVLHFAGKIVVTESVADPLLYYRANVAASLNLIEEVRRRPGCALVLSSTAAVYGVPQAPKLDEDHPQNPINPYGRSKRMIEEVLADCWRAYRLPSVSFRYFNAAGADPSAQIGEAHDPETHLIPNVLEAALGRGPQLRVFGTDYETRDGTCVRDYIHVEDLCRAHMQGVELLKSNPGGYVFNLGNGNGFTVKEVLATASRIVGREIPFSFAPRRDGDSPVLVADCTRAQSMLGWTPTHATLDSIIESAWRWHRSRRY